MTRLDIQIETSERQLNMEMLETDHLSAGEPIAIREGVTATWSAPLGKGAEGQYVFNLVVGAVSGVALNVVSSWLYDKLKGRNARLRINRMEVEIEPNKIRMVIEKIEKDGGQ